LDALKPITGALYDLLIEAREIQPRSQAFSLLTTRNSTMPSEMRQKWAENEGQARQYADEILSSVQETDDELVHVAVFLFLVEEGMNDTLIQVRATQTTLRLDTFLENTFRRRPMTETCRVG
jgi:hypothetical protein